MPHGRVLYHGISGGPCGYCGSDEDSFVSEAFSVGRLTACDYQHMIDQTWRRSGHLVYRPIYSEICCKPYTIRLDTHEFNMSRSQKKTLKRFQRHIGSAEIPEDCDLITWMAQKMASGQISERLRLEWQPASFDQESYELYRQYQVNRHGDDPDDLSPSRYEGFLISSPIKRDDHLGSFHHRWFLDGKLIAVGVLDVLSNCLSSVYFFHDPDLAKWSLGTVSALIEIALVRFMSQQHPELHYYYMGYYIEDCSKMRYKGDFRPSEILNPDTMQWTPLEAAQSTFLQPPNSIE